MDSALLIYAEVINLKFAIRHTKSKSYFFLYQKSLNRMFRTSFEFKVTLWICALMFWIHKGYFEEKFLHNMFVLKLFRIQKYIFTSKKKCEKGISVPPLTTVLWTFSFYIVADIENIELVFTFIHFFSWINWMIVYYSIGSTELALEFAGKLAKVGVGLC